MVHSFHYTFFGYLFIASFCKCHEYNAKGWTYASEYLSKVMNTSVDPCENFYDFVCGQWENEYANLTNTESEFEKGKKDVAEIIRNSIERIDLDNPKTESFKKSLKIFYQQCKSRSNDESDVFFTDTYDTLQNYFLPNLGSHLPWEDSEDSERQFWKLTGTMQRELGVSFLFEAEVLTADIDCQTKPVLHLRPVYADRIIVKRSDMLILLTKVISKYYNVTLDEQDIEDTIETAMKFEQDLTLHITKTASYYYLMLHPSRQYRLSIGQLQEEFSDINWSAYFDGLLPESIKNSWLKSDRIVMLDSPDFFRNLSQLIQNHTRVVSTNFGFMLVLRKYLWFFTRSAPKTLDRRQLLDIKVFADDICLDLAVRYFSPASFRLLCDSYNSDVEEWRNDVLLLKNTIFSALRFLIHGTKWMDAEDKMTLIDRLNQVEFYGDIPKWITDDNVVEAKTPKYNSSLSLIANDILAQKALFEQQFIPLVTGLMDDLSPSFVHNAFNLVRGKGSIRFLVGWQVQPFYNYLYPLAVKYGSTGFILGHELMHSFGTYVYRTPESEIRRLVAPDPYGLKNATLKQFEERCRCLVPHFDEYCLDDRFSCPNFLSKCNMSEECNIGNRTLEENVADSEAIKIAYTAYKFVLQTFGQEPPLPGMVDYTNDQIFFIAFAREFCTTQNLKKPYNLFGTHSAFKARVEQSLKNFPKFAEAFNCPKSSLFGGREKKCSIYGTN